MHVCVTNLNSIPVFSVLPSIVIRNANFCNLLNVLKLISTEKVLTTKNDVAYYLQDLHENIFTR